MTINSLPLFVRLAGRPVILLGDGDAADAKRRLLDRAGAAVVGEDADAALAIVAIDDEADALAAIGRLKARGVLVNAVDRPDHCDFTLPAIVDRDPVIVAIGTGGVSAGLAAALRQRLEALLPAGLGRLAETLHAMRAELRAAYPDAATRRRAIADLLQEGGALDPFRAHLLRSLAKAGAQLPGSHDDGQSSPSEVVATGPRPSPGNGATVNISLASPDPDDLTLRQARALASADRVVHTPDVPAAILNRARADAARIEGTETTDRQGLTVIVDMAR